MPNSEALIYIEHGVCCFYSPRSIILITRILLAIQAHQTQADDIAKDCCSAQLK